MEHAILPLPRETSRLILRPASVAEVVAIHEAIRESYADLHQWMDWAGTMQSLDETRSVRQQAARKFESGEDFAVDAFLKETGQFVLGVGLHPRNWKVPKFEIGYWCRSSMQRKGYTAEAVRAIAALAFNEMGANKVEIRCDSRNVRSRRVAERAGFRQEAQLANDDRANDGSLRLTIVYTMLPEDFHTGR
jgi:RimJ/RimL family protein N-acetyltransferase